MRLGGPLAGAILAAAMLLAMPAAAAPRVMSLDYCADQYVLALSPRENIVGLSYRADDPDSFMREHARGLPVRRATVEAVVAARPDVVVRYWGGDARLEAMLERRGVTVLKVDEATGFADVHANIRRVAAGLEQAEAGERMIAAMNMKLAAASGAWNGAPALYLTPGGFTAGPGTLVHAILEAAGLKGVAGPGYAPVSLEALVLKPPAALVLGFFDDFTNAMVRWGAGRHHALQRLVRERAVGALPSSIAGCPAWFAADGALMLAQGAPR